MGGEEEGRRHIKETNLESPTDRQPDREVERERRKKERYK
jgi:hypothetical protein